MDICKDNQGLLNLAVKNIILLTELGIFLYKCFEAVKTNHLFADKPFGVGYAYHFAKPFVAINNTFQKIGRGNIGLRAIVGVGQKLGAISLDRLDFAFKYFGDINYKIRL